MCKINKPFVILRLCASLSQDTNDVFNISNNFLFVPGVNGGMPTGVSMEGERKKEQTQFH